MKARAWPRQRQYVSQHRARCTNRAFACCHDHRHRLRHLRLRPPHRRRRHPIHSSIMIRSDTKRFVRPSMSATKTAKSPRRPRRRPPHNCLRRMFFCKRVFFSGCERPNRNQRKAAKLLGHSPAGMAGAAQRRTVSPKRSGNSFHCQKNHQPQSAVDKTVMAQRAAWRVPAPHRPPTATRHPADLK
jgi:hypothetical protein